MQGRDVVHKPEGVRAVTDADRVYQILRDQILSGGREPGEPLRQETIAAETKTSRTPIREAVYRLAADGLVENRANRGYYVADLTQDKLLELNQVRCVLEGYAARRACQFAPHDEVGVLRDELRARLNSSASAPSTIEAMDLKVHTQIAEWASNSILQTIISNIGAMNMAARARDARVHNVRVLGDLDALLVAIQEQKPNDAHKIMYGHIMEYAVGTTDLLYTGQETT